MVVARDSRESGGALVRAACRGIHAAGGTAIDTGVVPTPTACIATAHTHACSGIIITASHNPAQYNGYKMIHPSGRLFNAEECAQLYSHVADSAIADHTLHTAAGHPDESFDPVPVHCDAIVAAVDASAIAAAHIRIAVDTINAAAAAVVPSLLQRLGVEYVLVNGDMHGRFAHNPEPRPQHLTQLRDVLASEPTMWAGFAFDPDADRLAPMSERGEEISEEYTLGLAAAAVLPRHPGCIATNLSTSMLVDDIARSCDARVIRTKIGEANVVSAVLSENCVLGGEGNGGVIYPPVSLVRDGLCGCALIVDLMARQTQTISQLTAQWPRYVLAKEKITLDTIDADTAFMRVAEAFPEARRDGTDGLKLSLDGAWIHIRASNTEPILRCYAESSSRHYTDRLVNRTIQAIRHQ
jgi:phosphomannomutase